MYNNFLKITRCTQQYLPLASPLTCLSPIILNRQVIICTFSVHFVGVHLDPYEETTAVFVKRLMKRYAGASSYTVDEPPPISSSSTFVLHLPIHFLKLDNKLMAQRRSQSTKQSYIADEMTSSIVHHSLR
jgi:hypothetical protein